MNSLPFLLSLATTTLLMSQCGLPLPFLSQCHQHSLHLPTLAPNHHPKSFLCKITGFFTLYWNKTALFCLSIKHIQGAQSERKIVQNPANMHGTFCALNICTFLLNTKIFCVVGKLRNQLTSKIKALDFCSHCFYPSPCCSLAPKPWKRRKPYVVRGWSSL